MHQDFGGKLSAFVSRFRRADSSPAENGLDWLWKHRQEFEITRTAENDLPWDVKGLIELAFLLTILERHDASCERSKRLNEFVSGVMVGFDWHELAAFDPSAATVMATAGHFCDVIKTCPPFELAYLEYLEHAGYFHAMDRLPFRAMDLAYGFARMGIRVENEPTSLRSALSDTAFGQGQRVIRYTIDDVYSLTHAIFYITDMGLRSDAAALEEEQWHALRLDVIALTCVMMRSDNLDVLGELLLCWVMLDIEPSHVQQLLFTAGVAQMRRG